MKKRRVKKPEVLAKLESANFFDQHIKQYGYPNLLIREVDVVEGGYFDIDPEVLLEELGIDLQSLDEQLSDQAHLRQSCALAILLNWDLGKGKTYWLSKRLFPLVKNLGWTVLVVAHRVRLIDGLVREYNKGSVDKIENYKVFKKEIKEIGPQMKCEPRDLAICVNSITDVQWFPDVVIVDEIEGVLANQMSDVLFDKKYAMQHNVFKHFLKILQSAKIVILADGNMDTMTMRLLELIQAEKSVLLHGPRTQPKFVFVGQKKQHFELIEKQLKAGENIAVGCMSKSKAEELYHFIDFLDDSDKVLLSSERPEMVETAIKGGKTSEVYKTRLLIYTPVIDAGVSIETKDWFDHRHVMCSNKIGDATNFLQMTLRVRYPKNIEIFISGQGVNSHDLRELSEAECLEGIHLKSSSTKLLLAALELLVKDREPTDFSSLLEHYAFATVQRGHGWLKDFIMLHYEPDNIRDQLKDSSNHVAENIQEVQEILDRKRFTDFLSLRLSDYDIPELQHRNLSLTADESLALEKHRLQKFFGGQFDFDTPYGHWVIRNNHHDAVLKQCQMFVRIWFIEENRFHVLGKNESTQLLKRCLLDFEANLKTGVILKSIFSCIGLTLNDRDSVGHFVCTNDSLENARTYFLSDRRDFELLEIPKPPESSSYNVRWLTACLDKIGLEMFKHNQRRLNGRRIREYSINMDSYERMLILSKERLVTTKLGLSDE